MADVSPAPGKYQLKALHEEISFFDRKLAHLVKYDVFETEAARAAAVKKMTAKRDLLVKTAQQLTADGVEFSPNELPRSMRAEGAPEPEAVKAAPVEQAEPELPAAGASRGQRRQGSAFAGTSLDWEKGIREYMSKRAKA